MISFLLSYPSHKNHKSRLPVNSRPKVKMRASRGSFKKAFPLAAQQARCEREIQALQWRVLAVACNNSFTMSLHVMSAREALDLLTYAYKGNFAVANTSQSIERMQCSQESSPFPCITSYPQDSSRKLWMITLCVLIVYLLQVFKPY